ncbi:MAG: beta-ketoacyl-ACP synthase II [Candidatus Gastranaerophilales bacterium]|nr:beta-ketoacyl-ACP synthase II [Candidatus Gastranaerophilales bacterium]
MKRQVVVTGMGCVSPFGVGVDTLWNNLKQGKSAIRYLTCVDTSKHPVHIGGEVPEFDTSLYMDAKDARRMDKFIICALTAATLAIEDSGLDLEHEDKTRIGVFAGAAAGGLDTIQKNFENMQVRGFHKASPFMVPSMICNMAAGKIAIKFGLRGPSKAILTACATGAHSLGDAMRSIQYGDTDVMVAGGAEAGICDLGLGAFTSAKTLSKFNDDPKRASRPFDINRDGFIMSEGAAILILEEKERAIKRGAKIYAELSGYGQSTDAYDMVAPDPEGNGAILAMELALKDAGLKTSDIGYINAHGTSTHVGDIAESNAIAKLFGDKEQNKNLLVSSTKSMTGHMLGSAGSAEAIISIMAMREGIVPPTINLENQDPEVANLDYVKNTARKKDLKAVLSNSFGFGGHNAVLIFTKA